VEVGQYSITNKENGVKKDRLAGLDWVGINGKQVRGKSPEHLVGKKNCRGGKKKCEHKKGAAETKSSGTWNRGRAFRWKISGKRPMGGRKAGKEFFRGRSNKKRAKTCIKNPDMGEREKKVKEKLGGQPALMNKGNYFAPIAKKPRKNT